MLLVLNIGYASKYRIKTHHRAMLTFHYKTAMLIQKSTPRKVIELRPYTRRYYPLSSACSTLCTKQQEYSTVSATGCVESPNGSTFDSLLVVTIIQTCMHVNVYPLPFIHSSSHTPRHCSPNRSASSSLYG
jgi:hypothetical protein